ncbi:MAG TPA: hypothetical protein VEI03_15615 [Stellaceae bacterium]|nr:hypothetical protein [Stellaceae bacterium]
MTLLARVGLIDLTGTIGPDELTRAAAAINVQVQRDLCQFWPVSATVSALPNDGQVPAGIWPVYIVPQLSGPSGFHQSQHNQPYAEVGWGPGWTLAASHETLEMLVDPSGNRLVASSAIEVIGGQVQDAAGKFEYLVEICDPSESADNAYLIDDVVVSDFYTPRFFDPSSGAGTRYSFTGAITAPRQVLKGGYLSWWNPEQGALQQLQHLNPALPPFIATIGLQPPGTSLREFVNAKAATSSILSATSEDHPILRRSRTRGEHLRKAAKKRAELFKQ